MSNYAPKNKLKHPTGTDTPGLAATNILILLKTEANKPDINKLTNVPTILNNLKAKVDELDVDKLKTVPRDLKKLSDGIDNSL